MHLLITHGGTREYIDPVRFISNASSGKMGTALARAAINAGHKVTLISANVSLKPPARAKVIRVGTAGEMFDAVKKQFDKCDCLIMAAAVADYTPAKRSKTKLKKTQSDLTIKLKPTKDILRWAGTHKKDKLIVGFALEDKAIKTRAAKKLKEKNLDMIVANTPKAIGAEHSSVYIKTIDSKWKQIGPATKTALAKKIVKNIDTIQH
ncbi:MAG: phosphopantothenoylcysteine decarboxylase [Planctomycetes bacterium]|nr:phosphopantothenoylcysteine decarboxylase [Planctomycetota bacterium]